MGSQLFIRFMQKRARELRKQGPPGSPPRPGLQWKPQTHRWIRPQESQEVEFPINHFSEQSAEDYAKTLYSSTSTPKKGSLIQGEYGTEEWKGGKNSRGEELKAEMKDLGREFPPENVTVKKMESYFEDPVFKTMLSNPRWWAMSTEDVIKFTFDQNSFDIPVILADNDMQLTDENWVKVVSALTRGMNKEIESQKKGREKSPIDHWTTKNLFRKLHPDVPLTGDKNAPKLWKVAGPLQGDSITEDQYDVRKRPGALDDDEPDYAWDHSGEFPKAVEWRTLKPGGEESLKDIDAWEYYAFFSDEDPIEYTADHEKPVDRNQSGHMKPEVKWDKATMTHGKTRLGQSDGAWDDVSIKTNTGTRVQSPSLKARIKRGEIPARTRELLGI